MMTRNDFELLAKCFKESRPGEHWDIYKHVQWDLDVCVVARLLLAQNSRFLKWKFFEACGGLFNPEVEKDQ